jgi:hypothetical protein
MAFKSNAAKRGGKRTLAKDGGVVVLDLDNAVGLEGGGKLGPGLSDGACHSEGQNGEEEESTLHVVFVKQSTPTLGLLCRAGRGEK